jgi:hypothetical protein
MPTTYIITRKSHYHDDPDGNYSVSYTIPEDEDRVHAYIQDMLVYASATSITTEFDGLTITYTVQKVKV